VSEWQHRGNVEQYPVFRKGRRKEMRNANGDSDFRQGGENGMGGSGPQKWGGVGEHASVSSIQYSNA